MPFELVKSEILVEGRAFKVRRDTLKTPEHHETKFEIVEHGGSVVILPIDDAGNLLFVIQPNRHTERYSRCRGWESGKGSSVHGRTCQASWTDDWCAKH